MAAAPSCGQCMLGKWVMHEKHLRGVDLNLLTLLDALLRHGGVGAAASAVNLSQPATSRALGRLRALFDDPLLVRAGGATRLTPRALALAEPVARVLDEVRAMLTPAEFDPSAWTGQVTLAATDHQAITLLPALTARLRVAAPGLNITVRAMNATATEPLRTGAIQLGFGLAGPATAGLYTRTLYKDRFVTLMRRGHPAAAAPLTPARYAELDHAVVSVLDDRPGVVDDALAELGLRRRVVLRQPHFYAALAICAASDLLVTLPLSVAERFALPFALERLPSPVAGAPFTISLLWSPVLAGDLAQAWLRQEVVTASREAGLEEAVGGGSDREASGGVRDVEG